MTTHYSTQHYTTTPDSGRRQPTAGARPQPSGQPQDLAGQPSITG